MSGVINQIGAKSGLIAGRFLEMMPKGQGHDGHSGMRSGYFNLTSASGFDIAKFYHEGTSGDASEGACGIVMIAYKGWYGHYGGAKVTSFNTVTNSSYGSPGGEAVINLSSSEAGELSVAVGTDGATRILQISGGNGYGPNPVFITIIACSPTPWEMIRY